MLRSIRATRTLAKASSQARTYASPAVLSSSDVSPTGSITIAIKAGSRYEPAPGLAHVLKNSVFKGTSKRSQIRLVRETEMYGGVLSASLTRENLFLTAEFLKGDEGFFAEVLGDALVAAKFAPHEYNEEVLPSVASEYEQAIHDPTTSSFDLAHQLAFRTGLGNSLYASPHTAVDYTTATAFAKSAFSSPSNFAVVSTGVESGALKSLVSDFFVPSSAAAAAPLSSPAASYFGGEIRVPGHHGLDHFLLGFKGESLYDVNFSVLRFLLGGDSSIKWSAGTSPLSKLASGSSSVKAFNLGYSDAGLFGVYVTAPSAEVEGLVTKAIAEIKAVAGGASEEAVKQAVAKAKFAAASALETRGAKLEFLGAQLASSGSAPSVEEVLAKYDSVTVDSVSKAAASALKSKPTTVAYGNTYKLPYGDSFAL